MRFYGKVRTFLWPGYLLVTGNTGIEKLYLLPDEIQLLSVSSYLIPFAVPIR